MEVSDTTKKIIFENVLRDLKPSFFSVFWRVALAFAVGGSLSMTVCGQFGIGISQFSKGWNHLIHAHLGATQCAIVCGVIFAFLPILALRLFSRPMLFRRILHHYNLVQLAIIHAMGYSLYMAGSYEDELVNVVVWSLSAYAAFKVFGWIVDTLISSKSVAT